MPLRPLKLVLALSAALAAAPGPGRAARAAVDPPWTLEQAGRTYTFTLTVSSPLSRDVLLDVLFDPKHVAIFSKSAGRLSVVRSDALVNEVRFDTRKLIFTCSTTFRRTLDRASGSIDIEMLTFKAGWGRLAPHALSSSARYTVEDKEGYRDVVYRQVVETDKPVTGFSLRSLRHSMGEFARDLEQYLRRPDLTREPDPVPGGQPERGR